MTLLKDRKMGRFHIDIEVIANHPEVVRRAMRNCIVLEARTAWDRHAIEYLALHPSFTECLVGQEARSYNVTFVTSYDPVARVASITDIQFNI